MKRLACIAFAAAATLAAADVTAFNGTWKFNPQKSKLVGETFTIKQGADGMLVQSAGSMETKFKIDGKDYDTPMGYTVAWQDAGKDAWTTTVKLNGKPLFNDRVELSSDQKTLTRTSEGKRPNGEEFKESARYTRVGGGSGLAGTWRSEKVDTPAETLTIQSSADDVTMTYPGWNATVTAKFDGKGHSITGPTVPPGLAVTVKPVNAKTIDTETLKDGKPIAKSRMQISADGKTLTETATMAGQKQSVMYVYDKE